MNNPLTNANKGTAKTALFSDVFRKHEKYLSTKWNHYLPLYDRTFAHLLLKNEPVSILEIGVWNGGSLEVWKEFLPENSTIFGVDPFDACKNMQFSEGIKFLHGDGTNKEFIEANLANAEFDVIMDDGSHLPQHVIKSFETLWPKLKFGGLYVVEDTHTAYWAKYGGGYRRKTNHVEYFKNLVESINLRYVEQKDIDLVHSDLPILTKYHTEIASISFYDSVIIIEKYAHRVDKAFHSIVSRGRALALPSAEEHPRIDENYNVLECYRK